MRSLDRVFVWVAAAAAMSMTFAALYLVGQQLERGGADDAPERLASEIATEDSTANIDIATSLAPFYVVYRDGKAVAGTGYLHGSLAAIPHGVLDAATANGEDRVTWQPEHGLRFATVALARDDGTVVAAAQSLAPTERRIARLGATVLVGWVICLLVLALAAGIHVRLVGRPEGGG